MKVQLTVVHIGTAQVCVPDDRECFMVLWVLREFHGRSNCEAWLLQRIRHPHIVRPHVYIAHLRRDGLDGLS